ncbi:PREDICTED: fatty acid synthase-like [Vollenhovia emeryi]|uniref:fatty acid synthase-like n=1 Tax=Vollenhovia emeryi TaxID=411798 RepID=UPI0005F489F4|nr:PREDICTED: fatty acid synthase-like [Vollenhovia emeryi]XP_011866984.1 PREDICTED: fatty acid synthase-like [Vollenhovia emeryi]
MSDQFETVKRPAARESALGNEIPYSIDDDVVITGISGRLPNSSNIEEFKENLMNHVDMVSNDECRWTADMHELLPRTSKIKDIKSFDASFFGINPKMANVMDPQARMLLEVAYEAIVDSGVNPMTVRGSRTGVFIGVSRSETDEFVPPIDELTGYEVLGTVKTMLANRISYCFDFTGPSYMVDTACSSDLYAVHQAATAIRRGEIDAAIVGGVNLTLSPHRVLQLFQLNMLSEDGKCKAFDASANGYVRGEAVMAIYLRKAKDARRVYATVVHSKTNNNGYSYKGITYPSGEMQNRLMREIYSEAGINPVDVSYVEAHGTGTVAGDPEEVNSIDKLFCKGRKSPLLIGGVKSNTGHTEAASGLCSIAKVVIAMESGVLPANLHFKTPNPKITGLIEGRIRVVDKATPWNGGLVGINAFGFGGTNAHIILRSNPKPKLSSPLNAKLLPKLVAVSGRTKQAVHTLLDKAKEHCQDDEFLSLLHIMHNNEIRSHNVRGYEILSLDGTREMIEVTSCDKKRPIWFVLSGMGPQWPGMGRQLLSIETFQRSLRRCADALAVHDFDLMNIIMNATDETFDNVMNSFVSIAAMQVAFIDLLTMLGIHPDGIVGHSAGELGCAYADGAFTLEQTVLTAYYRGKALLESKLESGAMAAVGLTWEEAKQMCPPDITPACHNSTNSVTISGPTDSMYKFVQTLKSKDIFVKMVNSSGYALHSKYIAPAMPKLHALLEKLIPSPKQRSSRWISSSVPESAWNSPLAQLNSAEYCVNNMMSPVLFSEAIAHIPENAITIEVAPHGLLQAILRRSLSPTVTNISLHQRDHVDNLAFLLSNVGKLYMAGAQPHISKLYPPISFPVGRGTPMIGSLVRWDHSDTWNVPDFKNTSDNSGQCIAQIDLSKETDAYMAGHQIDGRNLIPAAGYMFLVWKTLAKQRGCNFEQLPVVFEKLQFHRATILPKEGQVKFSITIFKGSGDFEICESDAIVVSGNVRVSESIGEDQLDLPPPVVPQDETTLPLNTKDFYERVRLCGFEFSGVFHGIKFCDNYGIAGELYWFNQWVSYIDSMCHLNLVSTSLLHVASYIQYVAIDPVLHRELVDKLPKNGGLPVYHYKDINVIKSGGIEIRGIQESLVPRRQSHADPKYEQYTFVPYENSCVLVKDAMGGRMHALTVLLQIVYENIMTLKLKTVEVAGDRAAEALLAPLILKISDNQLGSPIINLQIVTVSADKYRASLKQMNVNADIVTHDINKALTVQDVHLVIAADVLSNKSHTVLKNLVANLKPGCFILLEETAAQLDLETVLKDTDLTLAGKQTDSAKKTYLLLKKRQKRIEPIVIQITEKNLSWLEEIKAAVKKFDDGGQEILFVSQGEETLGLVGLMTCMRRELSNVNFRYVFIQDQNAPTFSLFVQFYKEQLDKGLMANVLKGEQWGSYRYLSLDQKSTVSSVQAKHAYVNTLTRGDLSSLRWIEGPLSYYRPDNFPNMKLCSVYYAPLSCRDITLASGKMSLNTQASNIITEECLLGRGFSGRDADGRRVMGIVEAGGLATTVVADLDFLWEVPDKWSLEQAATIPIAYANSYYALFIRGQLKAGESILVHDGTGYVGLAAIAIALHADCTVFTTVDTLDKRKYLKKIFPQLNDKRIGNCRDTSFEQLINVETQGRGVDVVLNSLTGEKLQAGIRCLAFGGRFLDVNIYDLSNDSSVKMSMFIKNTYHSILLDMVFKENNTGKKKLSKFISEGIKNGAIRPLQSTVFSEHHLEQGFRFMAAVKHIGKVLVKIRDEEAKEHVSPMSKTVAAISRTYMNPEKSYILVGGLGGFGLELTDWMIARGARIIVLVSRSGIRTGYQAACVRRWRKIGVKIVISTVNVTILSGAERLIQETSRLAPVGGIFNLAAVLRDALIENQTEGDFKAVMLPKVDVTMNLDAVSRKLCPSIDYFVVFSSTSSGYGKVGQTNYGFANSTMERLMERRQANGLPGLAIQWGSFKVVGISTEMTDNDVEMLGFLRQDVSSCLATMDIFLQQPHSVLTSIVLAEKYKPDDDNKTNLVTTIAAILGIQDVNSVDRNRHLVDLGTDSLIETEIKQSLERNYAILLSNQEIRVLTFAKLWELSSTSSETS